MHGPDFDPVTITFVFELVLLSGLLYVLASDVYIKREKRRTLTVLVLLVIGQNVIFYLDIGSLPWAARDDQLFKKLETILLYSVRPVMIVLFTEVVWDKAPKAIMASWTLAGINAAVSLTALFSPVVFSIYPNGIFQRGPLGYTCLVISALLILNLLCFLIRTYRTSKHFRLAIPILNTLMLIVGTSYDMAMTGGDTRITGLGLALVGNCVFYYIWVHLQFVRAHENELKASQRIQLMKTQIRPHFLFNTLSTIRAEYARDPDLGEQTLTKFSKYLRQNLDAMEEVDVIPFSREMEHTRLYADIEMLRFPSVRVEYDLRDEDFVIPFLTVQPLVENAIRHGVRGRKEGIVSVSSRLEKNWHIVEIRDNGVGFDVSAPPKPGESHIGIENVRTRVEQVSGGSLQVKSEIGKGTTATLRIPASGGRNEAERQTGEKSEPRNGEKTAP
ncbi:MAG: histidine kinase [Clostridia bacterium]|nr:histidine kinase [Clostridia bacterium]